MAAFVTVVLLLVSSPLRCAFALPAPRCFVVRNHCRASLMSFRPYSHLSAERDSDDNPDMDGDFVPADPRDLVGRMARGMVSTGMKETVERYDVVVAKADVPDLGIFADQAYEVVSIYLQGLNPKTELLERIPLDSLEDGTNKAGYTKYIRLYSPSYHEEPVIVTPEEVGLVSLRDEVVDATLVMLPIFAFWVCTCLVFAGKYNERYGGNFVDALFGR